MNGLDEVCEERTLDDGIIAEQRRTESEPLNLRTIIMMIREKGGEGTPWGGKTNVREMIV